MGPRLQVYLQILEYEEILKTCGIMNNQFLKFFLIPEVERAIREVLGCSLELRAYLDV